MNHTIAIVAHTARATQAHKLMHDVGAAFMSIDNGTLGCNGNHKKVWNWISQHASDWGIVLEDDAQPVEGFREQAAAALAKAPTPIVSFYLGKHHINTLDIERDKQQAIAKAQSADAHWITGNQLLHAVAIGIRKDHLLPMLEHINQLPDFFPIDEAISHWAAQTAHISYTWPSLCNHADTPTLFRHHDKLDRPPGRTAYRTGTRDHWADRSVTL